MHKKQSVEEKIKYVQINKKLCSATATVSISPWKDCRGLMKSGTQIVAVGESPFEKHAKIREEGG